MQTGRALEQRGDQKHYTGIAQELRERFQNGVLSELTPYPHFVVWKYVVEQGKLKKRPFDPKRHRPAKITDPTTWTPLDTGLKALATGAYNGIGFVFADTDPFTGIDVDSSVEKDGTMKSWAKEIITALHSYTEYSPSQLGLHILTQATLQGAGRKQGNLEVYSKDRFFTITTDHVAGTPTTIEERQEAVLALYQRIAPAQPERCIQNTGGGVGSARLTELPPEAANDPLLQALLRGDMGRYGNDQSRADFVLLMKLLHWTADDRELAKTLFLASPLGQREKAQEEKGVGRRGTTNYVDRTIERILERRYNPPMKR